MPTQTRAFVDFFKTLAWDWRELREGRGKRAPFFEWDHPIRYLCRRLEELTGLPHDDFEEAAWRINTPNGLAPFRPTRGPGGKVSGPDRRDLRHLLATIRQLDQDGIAGPLMDELREKFPKELVHADVPDPVQPNQDGTVTSEWTNGLSNPLHTLIDQLGDYVRAVWRCHHASTKEEKVEALNLWCTLKAPFWAAHRIPVEAIRGLADPALSWCTHRGFKNQEHAAIVENAAQLITGLAMITTPCAMPSLYANEDEAQKVWDHQGDLLLDGLASQDALRRLAALTGDEWKGDVRMPWDSDPQRSSRSPETAAITSAPTKISALNNHGIDTRPDSPMPPEPLIEFAMRDVPPTLADMDNTSDYYAPTPAARQRIVLHHSLVSALGKKHRHGKAAAAWAIHRLVERGMLTARYGSSDMPSVQSRDGIWHGGDRHELQDLKYSLIESTSGLWDWWTTIAPEGWASSEASDEDKSITSRADAIHEAEVIKMQRRKQDGERRDRCLEKLKRLGSATSKLHQSQDRWTQNPLPDPSPCLHDILSAMTEVCQAFQSDGFDKVWERVDREATFNHYRSSLGPPEKARVAFDWSCRLLNRGFQGQLRQADVDITWNKPALRYGFNIVQILLYGVLGEQRIEFQEGSIPSSDCSGAQTDGATESAPPIGADREFNAFTREPLPDGRPTEYRQLACALLGVDELDDPPLPTVTVDNVDDPIRSNVGDLTDRQDQELAAKLGIGPREWDDLNEEHRIGRMRAAFAAAPEDRRKAEIAQPRGTVKQARPQLSAPLPDGPFGTDGFRYKGVEVRFRRAAKQRALVLALWDQDNHRLRHPRPVQDVLDEVYGEDHDTDDAAFRQLCVDTRNRIEKSPMCLTIETMQGQVQLTPRPP